MKDTSLGLTAAFENVAFRTLILWKAREYLSCQRPQPRAQDAVAGQNGHALDSPYEQVRQALFG